ncbi:MAG: hypothetical protein ACKO0M_11025 [Cyanobium sp.]
MEPSRPALADWLAGQDGLLSSDLTSPIDGATLGRTLTRIDARMHRLTLAVQAMARLLEAQGLLHEGDLLRLINEIDLSDGIADGRVSRPVSLRCSECGRINLGGRTRCLYCGNEDLQPLPPGA